MIAINVFIVSDFVPNASFFDSIREDHFSSKIAMHFDLENIFCEHHLGKNHNKKSEKL